LLPWAVPADGEAGVQPAMLPSTAIKTQLRCPSIDES
jgi:hypothetical protein